MNKRIKKISEMLIEHLLMLSSAVTSITILLIVLFLFKEGAGLFSTPAVEPSYVLAVHHTNSLTKLTANQIKDIFDAKYDNWEELGGKNQAIEVLHINDLIAYVPEDQLGEELEFVPQAIDSVLNAHVGMIAFFPTDFIDPNFRGKILEHDHISLLDFLGGSEWYPTAEPAATFGLLPLISGTLWVAIAAILFALPFGLAVAVYMAELADKRTKKILKPLIELLAGIPSVVYGFFGLVVLVPLIQQIFNLPVGETALAGSIILAIMALPTIITIAEDAITNVPRAVKEASLALGASHWQTIWKVVLPYSISGISAAVVLGIGRAIGETMAVLMVTGNSAIIPTSLLEPVRTIPATIAAELGESPSGGMHYKALFLLGCILFLITLVISISAEVISSKRPRNN